MTPAIRPAVGGDVAALWSILGPIFRAGESYAIERDIDRAGALAFWCGPPHRVFVAEIGGAVLGTYYLQPNQRGGGAHVANCGFATAAEAQGRGIARAMLDHALAEARAAGFRAMQFNFVLESNARAVATWQRAGFAIVGRVPEAYDHPRLGPVAALILHRPL